jgi:Na+/proline symporter
MGLANIDFIVIIGYLLFVTFIGLLVSKKATGSIDEYFLGGRSLPWFLLGISGMATFIDMGGTAYQCAWFYLLGCKGFWLTLEGAVALLLSFQMIYIGKWLNRSKVMTNAEWMVFRFGKGSQGEAARILSAITALVICAGMMTFFFAGAAKVLPIFMPFLGNIGEHIPSLAGNEGNIAAILFFALVGVYTVASGFYGVIYTDFVQAFLIIFLILYVGIKAWAIGTPEYFAEHAPAGWLELFPTGGNWSITLHERFQAIGNYVTKAKFLGVLIIFWLANNLLQGLATPFDSWTAQRYYAAKNEKESSLLVCEWIFLWSFRFLLMAGVGVLALGVSDIIMDPEQALSVVIAEYIPIGIKGLLLAALLAAGMSTIDSTVNSAGAYFVKDVYQRFFVPDAGRKHLIKISYLITLIMFIIGIICGWFAENIGSVWAWIIMGLFVGTLPPNILKWYWWRANGASFACGTIGGVLAALIIKIPGFDKILAAVFGKVPYIAESIDIQSFLFVCGTGLLASIIGTFAGKPTDMDTLVEFYKKTKPFGFWGPVRKQCEPDAVKEIMTESRRDLILLLPAFVWHLSLFLLMSSLIFKRWHTVAVCSVICISSGIILYKYWYKNLKTE